MVAIVWGNCILILLVIVLLVILVHRHRRNAYRAQHLKELEETWMAPILSALAGENEPATVHELVRDADAFFFLEVLLGFSNVTEEEPRERLVELARPFLPKISERFEELSTPERAIAILVLTRFGGAPYLDLIERSMGDPSPLVAMVAARFLCQSQGAEFAPKFLDHADRFQNWNVQLLGSMLAELGDEAMMDLTDALVDLRASDRKRAVAAHAIALVDPGTGALAAIRVLEEEDDPSVELVAACLRIIQAARNPEHLQKVREYCRSDEFVIRVRAIDALKDLGREEEDRQLLAGMLCDENYWVALRAAEALAARGEIETLEEMEFAEGVRGPLIREVIEQTELNS